jgi:hypothetical protein
MRRIKDSSGKVKTVSKISSEKGRELYEYTKEVVKNVKRGMR